MSSPGEAARVDALLAHVLQEVQLVSGHTATPAADRATLASLRELLFPGGKVDVEPGSFGTRLGEVLTVARWLGGGGPGDKQPFILTKHRQLSVALNPAEFPTLLSQAQAQAWDRSDVDADVVEALEAEWQTTVDPTYAPKRVAVDMSPAAVAERRARLTEKARAQRAALGIGPP